jgi:hypothetical protein
LYKEDVRSDKKSFYDVDHTAVKNVQNYDAMRLEARYYKISKTYPDCPFIFLHE